MTIYTAGYGNLGFEPFIERLRLLKATHLVDVRRSAGSKYWVEFRRPLLDDLIAEAGLKYVWMGNTIGGLGDREPPRTPDGEPDYQSVWNEAAYQKGLDTLLAAAQVPGRVLVLMCGCLRPHECHRGFLLGPALLERGIELTHVDANGSLVGQREIMVKDQKSLFEI